jgi:hypothetical protein
MELNAPLFLNQSNQSNQNRQSGRSNRTSRMQCSGRCVSSGSIYRARLLAGRYFILGLVF